MTSSSWGLILALCFLTSLLATRAAVALLWRGGVIDTPNDRSSHDRPVPRGGGIVFVTVFLAGIALTTERFDGMTVALLAAGTLVAAVGLVDDLRPLPVLPRLLAHVGAGLCVSILVEGSVTFGPWEMGPLADRLLVTFVVVAFINVFNFMDGIDGLTASHAIVSVVALGLMTSDADTQLWRSSSLLAGAVAGFLVWNWPPARVFMGDVGSGFLGCAVAVMSIAAVRRGTVGLAPVLIAQTTFLVDAGATVIHRMLKRERWYEPHRQHAYQRGARTIGSHTPVVVAFVALDLVAGAVAVIASTRPGISTPLAASAAIGGIACWLVAIRSMRSMEQQRNEGTAS